MADILTLRHPHHRIRSTLSRKLFMVFCVSFLLLLSALCIFPLVHVLAVSFSSAAADAAGRVSIVPVDFSLDAYRFIIERPEYFRAMFVSVMRIVLGLAVHMTYILLTAYPLSKEKRHFRWRNTYVWYFFVTMLFSGGLIPTFLVVRFTGLLDSIWSLILPMTVYMVYNVILLLNFFRQLPRELEEAAHLDGASHWRILAQVFVPVSAPAIATIALFVIVAHWNDWFSAIIYMNSPEGYPLQTYLHRVLTEMDQLMSKMSSDTIWVRSITSSTARAAQIFVGMVPVLVAYPFLQRYFTKGITLGSVKG